MRLSFCSLILPASLAAAVPSLVLADEFGRVLSSTPIVQATSVPQQVCSPQAVTTSGGKTGAGAVIGAVAGGAIGNQIGRGSGRAAATAVGIVGGAVLGHQIEGATQPQTQVMQQCSTQYVTENRIVGYTVQYEYAGRQYAAQMPSDPGAHVRVQILPVGGTPLQPGAAQPGYYQPGVISAPR
jgi:uncharacterized protein YcfJ